jgi:DNA replication protein DnaC
LLRHRTPEVEEEYRRREAEDAERQRRREEAERREQLHRLAKSLGPRYSPERVRMEDFVVYHPAQGKVLDQLRGWMDSWPGPLADGRGLVLMGPCGTGKDRLQAAALYHAIREHRLTCAWVSGLDLFAESRDRISRNEPETDLVARLAEPQVLAVSDPLPAAGELTGWNVNLLLQVIDRRYRQLKSTWLTLNAADEAEAEARLSAPLFDRLREGAMVLKCFWPSYRERQGKGQGAA